MSFEARWIASVTASVLHTAECLIAGLLTPSTHIGSESRLAAALAEPAARLGDVLQQRALEPGEFFAVAVPAAVHGDAARQLVEQTLARLGRANDEQAGALTRAVADLLATAKPNADAMLAELELRSGPLREQWEARGPGLLAALRRLTEPLAIASAADVILVQPVLGGGGGAHPKFNAVHLEAVLTNPWSELPEIARLAWCWSQLSLDLPTYAELMPAAELSRAGRLAFLPATLAAAQEVELARLDRATLSLACEHWPRQDTVRDPAELAETLQAWWESYYERPTPWRVALAALARLLHEPGTVEE